PTAEIFTGLEASDNYASAYVGGGTALGNGLYETGAFGLEGGALGNEEYNAGKGGGFVRLNLRDTEFTLSGGFTGNYLLDDPSSYVALGVYRTF
ncbi:MAG: hypothetical protein WAU90_08335, partial [Methyloceanibacter sp.]